MKKTLAAATLALLAAAAAHAEPFATRYAGTVANSDIPGVTNGQPYYVTLVFDNGGNTVLNQSWSVSQLTCVIWEMAGGTIVYAQDLAAYPPDGAGTFTTGANGYPTSVFSTVSTTHYANYSATSPITGNAGWVANGTNPVFGYLPTPSVDLGFHDADGGAQMAANRWGPAQQFSGIGNGQCAAPAAPPPTPNATPVPTLGHGALALLTCALGVAGFIRRRQRG